jgi:methionyl-tRNA formyltransferase
MSEKYVVACATPWFGRIDKGAAYEALAVSYIGRREELTLAALDAIGPRYVFFPHWSWIVPEEILAAYECVCFHSTPLPYGRGGSPVQNMIARGHEETDVTALRMTRELDAGPVYCREKISLLGGGDEIFLRIAAAAARMIVRIAAEKPEPVPQAGEATVFKRRTPAQSALPQEGELKGVYDHIRMLDAEGYPPAFIEYGDFILELRRPALRGGGVEADVVIRKKP